ncbi:putative lipoprotein [Myxococcus stipitatus DSM 14675]|uniref:Putative lipoprotein n=1 Tax=Myxococcus stipitatus (strain DSM 14675 / JCM 12634 / Mx s8) TaxID=1278073 RepID=L7UKP9_MYXSD|nr:lipoprotein [Myxococcus stipitatus]AGC48117.1 putative lipoprotein [Myxococcus stipitatus DSM 14675]
MAVIPCRIRMLLAVLWFPFLAACDDDSKPSSPDAGPSVWDGTYEELEDRGEWIDPGHPFAPCAFDTRNANGQSCEELARFDTSACAPEALATIPLEGVYQSSLRVALPLEGGGTRTFAMPAGFRLRDTAATSTMFNQPLVHQDTQGGRFTLIGRPLHRRETTTLVGCQTPAPHVITGCFAVCRNDRVYFSGTFEAQRIAMHPGEPASSEELTPLAEHPIALGMPVDVYVTQGHAYVVSISHAGRAGGLTVFDVTNPRNPLLKTRISLPEANWNGVWAKGNALYIASEDRGTLVYDISQPADPLFLRDLPTGAAYGTHTVLVDGDRLYSMAPLAGTYVYDVTSPQNPVLRTVLSFPEEVGEDGPHDAFAYENRLYLSHGAGGYIVTDVTSLDDIQTLGQYNQGSWAHHSAVGTFAGKTLAFEGGETNGSHLRVLDVTDPARIALIGEFRMRQSTSMHNLILRGHLLYVAWYHEGLRVLDVSNPTRPKQVAHFHTYREEDPTRGDSLLEGAIGIRVPGDGYVYVVDTSRGLLILGEH